jgi:CheY-like chemotaxis protein
MTSPIVVCLDDPIADRIDTTLLWRSGIDVRHLRSLDEARSAVQAHGASLIIIDRDDAQAEAFVRSLRADERTRGVSIVVAARGDLRPTELQLLDAGANAVLRLPAGPEWDARLSRLTSVPLRRAVRLPVRLQIQGRTLLDLESVSGTILNLSATGILVECDRSLELCSEVGFSFFIPGAPVPILGRGRVVRDAGAGHFGIEFAALSPEAAAQIARLRS